MKSTPMTYHDNLSGARGQHEHRDDSTSPAQQESSHCYDAQLCFLAV